MLLNKPTIKAAALFVSSDETRPALHGVHVMPEAVEATDGHGWIRIALKDQDQAKEFPEIPGFSGPSPVAPEAHLILEPKALLDMFPKRGTKYLPLLQNIALAAAEANGSVQVAATDLENPTVANVRAIEGPYPNCQTFADKYDTQNPVAEVYLDPNILKKMCDAAIALGSKKVKLGVRAEAISPMSFVVYGGGGQIAEGLLMPVRHDK